MKLSNAEIYALLKREITDIEIIEELQKIQTATQKGGKLKAFQFYSVLNPLFFEEKLNTCVTKGREVINFYEFYTDFWMHYDAKPYIHRFFNTLIQKYENKHNKLYIQQEAEILYKIFSLNYAVVTYYRPTAAIHTIQYIQQHHKPQIKKIIDPFAGWGARMTAAFACGIEYCGLDSNINLLPSYNKLLECMTAVNPNHKCQFINTNSAEYDYSAAGKYDLILSCPPYYQQELYGGQPIAPAEFKDWVRLLYRPVLLNAVKHISNDGIIALTLNQRLYNDIVKNCFNVECCDKMQYNTTSRRNSSVKGEFIYIWKAENIRKKI